MDASSTGEYAAQLREAAGVVQRALWGEGVAVSTKPVRVGIILGSGLSGFVDELVDATSVGYSDIPHAPRTTVAGHAGKLCLGRVAPTDEEGGEEGSWVLCVAGRVHPYEGLHMFQLAFLVRLLRALGCRVVVATNAAGGALEGMWTGALMVIRDHLNFYKRNPLHDTYELRDALGSVEAGGGELYSTRLAALAHEISDEMSVRLFDGVYAASTGPSYETHQEVRSFRALGTGCFGMSTVPEALAANAMGMEVFAMSLVTNLAAGLADEVLTHGDVTDVAGKAGPLFVRFMRRFLVRAGADAPELPDVGPADAAGPGTAAPLPAPTPAPASVDQIAAAADAVRAALQAAADVVVVVPAAHQEAAGVNGDAEGAKRLALADVPHWPATGAAARAGAALVARQAEHGGGIALCGVPVEGLACEEATFLAEVFAALGCRAVVHSVLAQSTSDGDSGAQGVRSVADIMDWTTVHAVSPQRLAAVSGGSAPTEVAFAGVPLLAAAAAGPAAAGAPSPASSFYMHIPGPTQPTPTERAVAAKLGCQLVGCTALPLCYAARALGMGVAVVADVGAPSAAAVPAAAASSSPSSPSALRDALAAASEAARADAAAQPPAAASATTAEVGNEQVGYVPAVPRTGTYEEVEALVKDAPAEAAEAVSSAAAVVVANASYAARLAGDGARAIPLGTAGGGVSTTLYVGGSQLPAVMTAVDAWTGRSPADSAGPVRVAKLLGAQAVALVGPYVDCTGAGVTAEDAGIAVLRDHILLSGRNPLTGHNDDRWGARFFDVSGIYDATSRDAALSALGRPAAPDLPPPAAATTASAPSFDGCVRVASVVGPAFASAADAAVVRGLGLEGLSPSIVHDAVVAHHVGLPVLALGIREVSISPDAAASTSKPQTLTDADRDTLLATAARIAALHKKH